MFSRPAGLCLQCGEKYVTAQVPEKIRDAAQYSHAISKPCIEKTSLKILESDNESLENRKGYVSVGEIEPPLQITERLRNEITSSISCIISIGFVFASMNHLVVK